MEKQFLFGFFLVATLLLVVSSEEDVLKLPVYSREDLRREQEQQRQQPALDHRGNPKVDGRRTDNCTDNTFIDFATRLIGCYGQLSPQAGRLEVYYKGAWGTVCDDYFNNLDAQVACYDLGFSKFEGLNMFNHFDCHTDPATKTVLDDVQCEGTEPFLDRCLHAVWTEHNCIPEEDVSIACSAAGPAQKYGYPTRLVNTYDSDSHVGRLEIYHDGVWGTVCDDRFDNVDAGVACRALNNGYATGIQVFEKDLYGRGEGKIWLDEMLCTTGDYNIGNCAHDPWGLHDCNHEEDVMIRCGQCFDVLCQHGGRCKDEFTTDCQCLPGFDGQHCETEVDLCESAPCLNGGTCDRSSLLPGGSVNLPYRCHCAPGFTGATCEISATTTAAPPDRCLIQPCSNGATCINQPPLSFICLCPDEFTGERCDTPVTPP